MTIAYIIIDHIHNRLRHFSERQTWVSALKAIKHPTSPADVKLHHEQQQAQFDTLSSSLRKQRDQLMQHVRAGL